MTFVNESVPTDAKEKYDLTGFVGPFGPCKVGDLELYKWTIDRERNAFLLFVGGGGGAHQGVRRREWYGLWWGGEIAHFAADEVITKDSQGQLLTWDQASLTLPANTNCTREHWIGLLRDALDAKGLGYNRNYVQEVKCVFQQGEE